MSYDLYKTNYFDKFCCTADKCSNNCCHDWRINLSKSDYNSLKAFKFSDQMKDKIKNCVKRVKPAVNDRCYAYIVHTDEGKCPFNNDQGLCELHLKSNKGDLIHTCTSYPRVTNVVFNTGVEKSCHTSCEAVVSLLTELTEGIKIIKEQVSKSEYEEIAYSQKSINNNTIEKRPILNFYLQIKNCCIYILQNRKLSLDDRILFLGLFLQKLNALEKASSYTSIPELIKTIEKDINDPRTPNYLNSLHGNSKYMLMSNSGLILCLFEKMDFLTTVINNLEIKNENGEFSWNEEKYSQYYDSFMAIPNIQEFILENLAVNIFIEKLMPFNKYDLDVWKNFCIYCRYYNLLKFGLSTYLAGNKDKDSLIKAAAKFSREILHSNENYTAILKELEVLKLSNIGDIVVLIRK